MSTVRETLTETYGDNWERSLSHVVTVAERSEMTQTRNERGYADFRHDYHPVIVMHNTVGRDVHGYEDPVGVSNYRVLRDQWSDIEGLSDGPYSGTSCIALDLDSEAPEDLAEVLDSLADYPLLSDDEHSMVEMEMIREHWESYGKNDVFDAVAEAIGADSRLDLTEYAERWVTRLVWDGIVDYGYGGGYPVMEDVSSCDFGGKEIAAWIRARLGLVVPVKPHNGYGEVENFAVLTHNLIAG